MSGFNGPDLSALPGARLVRVPRAGRLGSDAGVWRRVAAIPLVCSDSASALPQRIAADDFKALVRRRKYLERGFPRRCRRRCHDVSFLLRKRRLDHIKKSGRIAVLAQKKRYNQVQYYHAAWQLNVQFIKGVGHWDFSSAVRLVRAAMVGRNPSIRKAFQHFNQTCFRAGKRGCNPAPAPVPGDL